MNGPKLINYKQQPIPNTDKKIEIISWKHPKGWTKEEVDICIKYYQLQAKKLGMNLQRYMREFH